MRRAIGICVMVAIVGGVGFLIGRGTGELECPPEQRARVRMPAVDKQTTHGGAASQGGLHTVAIVGSATGDSQPVTEPGCETSFGQDLPFRESGEAEDPDSGELCVTVLEEGQEGLADVDVSLSVLEENGLPAPRGNSRTGPGGTATFRLLRPGHYRVSATLRSSRVGAMSETDRLTRSTYVPVLGGARVDVSIPFSTASGGVTGRVVRESGGAVSGVLVELCGRGVFFTDKVYGKTDERGCFRIDGVPEGKYEVRLFGGGIPTSDVPIRSVNIKCGGVAECDVVVSQEAHAAQLRGVVRDSVTQLPVSGAVVTVYCGRRHAVSTNKSGEFAFEGLSEGLARLSVSRDGYAFGWFLDVPVGEGALPLELEVGPAAVLHIRARGPDSVAATGWLQLSFSPKGGVGLPLTTSIKTDAEGTAVFRQGMVGDYELSVSMRGVGNAIVRRLFRAGDNELVVDLR